jgi:hypothetical protein
MHDKKSLIELYRKTFTTLTDEQIEAQADFMSKKYSTLRQGDNVIHLDYYSVFISDNDITTIENELAKFNLQLSRFDKMGVPYASLEDIMLQMAFFLGDKTTQDVLTGVGTNALWDAIKAMTMSVWQKIKTSRFNNNKSINYGIKLTLDKNTKFEFKIDGDFSEDTALKSLDKIIDFLKTTKVNETIKRPNFVRFNEKAEKWEVVDVDAELSKKIIDSIGEK